MSEVDSKLDNIVPLKKTSNDYAYERPANLPEPVRRGEAARASKVQKAKRRMAVMDYRAAGLTYEQIAEIVGLSPNGVARIINNTLEEWGKRDEASAAKIRTQKLFELDQLKRAIWPKALRGDIKAIREVTKIISLQARISGAESPIQHEHHGLIGNVQIDTKEIEKMERVWIEQSGTVEGTAIEDGSAGSGEN
jgi:DNA-binding CsgD family transcriptional regulator